MYNIPIAYIAYNRFNQTKKTFQIIKKIKPSKLVVILDGPKNHHDKKKCYLVQKFLKSQINWKPKLNFLISKSNKGLEKNIIQGLNFVFKKYSKAVIVEDDCDLDVSFFSFAEKVLHKFKNNKKIFGVTSQTFLDKKINNTYYYSKYAHCWGWATWANRWNKFDPKMKFRNQKSKKEFWRNYNCDYIDEFEKMYWERIYSEIKKNRIKSWNYRWQFNIWHKKGFFIHPSKNLVHNIGIDNNGTNTKKSARKKLSIKKTSLKYKKLNLIKEENVYDSEIFDKVYFSYKFFVKYYLLKTIFLIFFNKKYLKRLIFKNKIHDK